MNKVLVDEQYYNRAQPQLGNTCIYNISGKWLNICHTTNNNCNIQRSILLSQMLTHKGMKISVIILEIKTAIIFFNHFGCIFKLAP